MTTAMRPTPFILLVALLAMHQGPCVAQTPEQQKYWEGQRAQELADEKARSDALTKARDARKADPMAWVRSLDPLSSGGWEFRAVASDGSWATFTTDHQMKRSGHLVTLWLRQEYAEVQHVAGGDPFLSNVETVQFDCDKARSRVLVMIFYAANNIHGAQRSEDADTDDKQSTWNHIVPGTPDELDFQWACSRGAAGTARS